MTLAGGSTDESRIHSESTEACGGTHRQVTQVHGLGLHITQALGSCSLLQLLKAPSMHIRG